MIFFKSTIPYKLLALVAILACSNKGLFAQKQYQPQNWELVIEDEEYLNLLSQREVAMTLDLLTSSFRESVPAKIIIANQIYDAEIRLKGDLGDHWEDLGTMSFRVKVLNGKTINGIKQFSIQHPKRRLFLDDWLFNKLLEYHGMLSTHYRYVSFKVNGKEKGLYCVEEYADKYLLERNHRREGPVFKVDDKDFWTNHALLRPGHGIENMASFGVKPLGGTKLLKKEVLSKQYELASQLLHGFVRRDYLTHEVFEVKDIAKAFALSCDVFGQDHAMRIPNIRFYLNPISAKIESIPFDSGSPTQVEKLLGEKYFYLYDDYFKDASKNPHWFRSFFHDEVFRATYLEVLQELSDKSWVEDFWKSIEKEYRPIANLFAKEYPGYKLNEKQIQENVKHIASKLADGFGQEELSQYDKPGIPPNGLDWPRRGLQVGFNSLDTLSNTLSLQVANLASDKIEVVGLLIDKQWKVNLNQSVKLKAKAPFEFASIEDLKVKLPKDFIWSAKIKAKLTLLYREKSSELVLSKKVSPHPIYDKESLGDDFFRASKDWKNQSWFKVNESKKTIRVKDSKQNISENIIIPMGYKFVVPAGTSFEFSNNACLVSYSPVFFNGTESSPIKLYNNSANPGAGLLVLNGTERSELKYVEFQNLRNPNTSHWQITGAVTFYESDVSVSDCVFKDNLSEDALNIIRSDFSLQNCVFENTFSDAFDADFCSGTIADCVFTNNGNDGIDVSGTTVTVTNTNLSYINDKGISSGEGSSITASGVSVSNAFIGLASKDRSTLVLDGVKVRDCKYDVSVYQKKPEFGPASIKIDNGDFPDGFPNARLEQNSLMTYNGKKRKGKKLSLYSQLYHDKDFAKLERYIVENPTDDRYTKLKALYNKYDMYEAAKALDVLHQAFLKK